MTTETIVLFISEEKFLIKSDAAISIAIKLNPLFIIFNMSSGSHLSKELLDLVKSIGESRSKQEEDKIITGEALVLKQKFLERNLSEKKMRELLIRAIYVEMLGHDA